MIVELQRDKLAACAAVYEPIERGMEGLVEEMTTEELKAVVAFISRFNEMTWKALKDMGRRED